MPLRLNLSQPLTEDMDICANPQFD